MGGKSSRRKGSYFERKVAKIVGGRRNPLSGSAGGGDNPIGGALANDWFIEAKYGSHVPKFFFDAYEQAKSAKDGQDQRFPAVVLGGPHKPTLFIAKLEDVVQAVQQDG